MQAGLLMSAECLLTTEMRPPLRVPCSSTIERVVRPGDSHPALLMAAALAAATAQPQNCTRRPLLTPSAADAQHCAWQVLLPLSTALAAEAQHRSRPAPSSLLLSMLEDIIAQGSPPPCLDDFVDGVAGVGLQPHFPL